MKNSKLLNKKYLSIILFYLFLALAAHSQEPVDIWNIGEKKTTASIHTVENNEQDVVLKNTAKLLDIGEFETKRFLGNTKIDQAFLTCTIQVVN